LTTSTLFPSNPAAKTRSGADWTFTGRQTATHSFAAAYGQQPNPNNQGGRGRRRDFLLFAASR